MTEPIRAEPREPAPRVAPGGWRELGPGIWLFSRLAGRVSRTEPPAVFTTLGRHHGLFWGWLHFAGRMMPGGRIPRPETELVILRVAARTGSTYEWTQHARLALRAGLTQAEIDAVAVEVPAHKHAFADRDAMLLAVTDELLADEDLSDETWALARRFLDERRAIELVLLVGHYRMLATALRTLRVRPDRPRIARAR